MNLLFIMIVCGALAFLLRFSFIGGSRFLPKSEKFQHVLRYVPPAVLAAIIAPEIFAHNGAVSLGLENLRLWAALVAVATAYLTRNTLATIAAGMAALWCLQAIFH